MPEVKFLFALAEHARQRKGCLLEVVLLTGNVGNSVIEVMQLAPRVGERALDRRAQSVRAQRLIRIDRCILDRKADAVAMQFTVACGPTDEQRPGALPGHKPI